jgi:tetratricopeptide (TPR) repeat protein
MTETAPGTARADWLRIARQHYQAEDFSAAEVALRKAADDDPENPEVFITWAWVCLGTRETERAKEYADEAYVLLPQDGSVGLVFEVNLVRGWTAYHTEHFKAAVESYKTALSCAHLPERRADVLVRKALAHEQLKQWGEMWECVQAALPLAVSLPAEQRQDLADAALRAIRQISGDTVEGWESYLPAFTNGHGPEDVESRVRDGIAHRVELLRTSTEARRLNAVPAPEGPCPKFPKKSMWTAIILTLSLIGGVWWLTFLIVMIPMGFVTVGLEKRSKWKKQAEVYQTAQEERKQLLPSIKRMLAQEEASGTYQPCTPQIRT